MPCAPIPRKGKKKRERERERMMWDATLVYVCWEAQEFAISVTFFVLGILHAPISMHVVLESVLVCAAVCVFGVVAYTGGIE